MAERAGGSHATLAAPAARCEEEASEFSGGAPLKTDPELERLLERAELFVTDRRYDLASVLWQKVLDETGDTLVTRDGRIYRSLSEEVEQTLAKLPPEGLRVYRLTADGRCPDCDHALAGVFGDAPGTWGTRYRPVVIRG